jgi:hypothetical protein
MKNDTHYPHPGRSRMDDHAEHSVTGAPDALHEILVTTALNQRLLMRILSHLENSSWERVNKEADSFREHFERHYAPDAEEGAPAAGIAAPPGD